MPCHGTIGNEDRISLFCIKQKGSIAEFVREFEDLSSQVQGISEFQLECIFLNGLTDAMREVVVSYKPQNLPEMIQVALSSDKSTLLQVVQKELTLQDYCVLIAPGKRYQSIR